MISIIFLFGLAVGSFLNAWIYRMNENEDGLSSPSLRPSSPSGRGVANFPSPRGRGEGEGISAWKGRSMCPKCRKPLGWYELIPLVSFFIQLGRCRGCKQKIDWQYPIVEFATGILFVISWYVEGSSVLPTTYYLLHTIRWYLLSILVVLFVYDLRYGLVPDRVVLPAIGVAALYTVILSRAKDLFTMQGVGSLHSARASVEMTIGGILLAITIGAGFFALQYYLSRGRWLGAGDIRIGALMGAIVGWPLIFEALVISYLIGGLFAGILLILRKKQFGQTLPLGTFLTLGTVITILYGQQIWSWYWHI